MIPTAGFTAGAGEPEPEDPAPLWELELLDEPDLGEPLLVESLEEPPEEPPEELELSEELPEGEPLGELLGEEDGTDEDGSGAEVSELPGAEGDALADGAGSEDVGSVEDGSGPGLPVAGSALAESLGVSAEAAVLDTIDVAVKPAATSITTTMPQSSRRSWFLIAFMKASPIRVTVQSYFQLSDSRR